ncbi:MAG: methionine--tRNA ligase [Desulfomonilia bacterium]
MSKYFYITTPIYYVNAKPHLGHVYTTVIADVLARYHKLFSYKVFFLTGTDEHGDKIMETAKKLGTTPKLLADENSGRFRDLWPELTIENNRFIRTTEPDHVKTVQGILQDVYDKGDIYFGEYGGNYCVGCERFYTDSEIVDGKCPIHQTEFEYRQEQNYFFRMEKYRPWLVEHINTNPDFIRPERYRNEVLGMLREPLDDLCISRPKTRLSWGIELPFDSHYVCYVWFDALINYLTGIGYPDGSDFQEYWRECQHLVGKDILKPHAVYWSTMLKATGVDPYRHLNVHGFWNIDQTKMSKSLGNVIDPLDLKNRYGVDAFRYFLVREMVFGLDSNFSEEALIDRYNADLANDLGNLVSRSTSMVKRYFDGVLPEVAGQLLDVDTELRDVTERVVSEYSKKMENLEMHSALISVWSLISALNKYIDRTAPWELAKSDTDRLSTVMYYTMEALRHVALLVFPVMPGTSKRILEMLGLEEILTGEGLSSFGQLTPGRKILTGKALFPRVEKPVKEEVSTPRDEDNLVDIAEFSRLRIQAGEIVDAQRLEKSDKLLLLQVDVGRKIRIVAGIAHDYRPEDLVGRYIAVVTNLKPVKLKGITSEGMLLATDTPDGRLSLITFDKAPVLGARVR